MGKLTTAVDDHWIIPATVLPTHGHQHEFRRLGQPIPASVSVRLLVDTGSKRSAMIPGVIGRLKATLAGMVRVETSFGIGETELYWVRFEFPGSSLHPISQVPVARLKLPPP
jgi:hypothetical protein